MLRAFRSPVCVWGVSFLVFLLFFDAPIGRPGSVCSFCDVPAFLPSFLWFSCVSSNTTLYPRGGILPITLLVPLSSAAPPPPPPLFCCFVLFRALTLSALVGVDRYRYRRNVRDISAVVTTTAVMAGSRFA